MCKGPGPAEVGRGGRPRWEAEVVGHTRTWIRSDDPEKPIGRVRYSDLGTQLEEGLGRLPTLRNMWDCLRCDCIRRIIATNYDGNTEQESWSQDTPGHTLHGLVQCCKPTTQCSTRL